MDWAGWATFGFVATVVLTGIMVASQLLGLSRMHLPLILGTIFVGDPDRARVVGFLIHLVNGQIFALLYAGAFALIGRASWWLGALFGLVHGLDEGLADPSLEPLMVRVRGRVRADARIGEPDGPDRERIVFLDHSRKRPLRSSNSFLTGGTL